MSLIPTTATSFPATARASAAPAPLPAVLRRTIRGACIIAVFFVCTTVAGDVFFHASGHDNVLGVKPLFDLRVEGNIPTYFHAVLLLAAAYLAAHIAHARTQSGALAFRRHWGALSAIFAFLSVDEAAALHERLNEPLRDAFATDGILYFPWVVPYALLTLLFAVAYWRFLRAFEPWYRYRITAAGVLYVAGALGTEFWMAWHYTAYGADPTYYTVWLLGETLEMAGMLLFIYTLMKFLVTMRHASAP